MENYYDPARGDWVTAGSRYDAIVSRPRYAGLDLLADTGPAERLALILELIAELPDDLVHCAGAGPLESLLHSRAAEVIGVIEAEAARNARFRRALFEMNVTRGHFPAELEARILAAVGAGPSWLLEPDDEDDPQSNHPGTAT